MVKVVKLFEALVVSFLLFLHSCERWTNATDVDYNNEQDIYFEGALEDYELDLLWQLKRLKPLMGILTSAKKSSARTFDNSQLEGNVGAKGRRYYNYERYPTHSPPAYSRRRVVPSYDYDTDRNGGGYGGHGDYGGYGSYGGYGGHGGHGAQVSFAGSSGSPYSTLGIVSLFATGLLYLLFFYYISTSTTSSRRRRRHYVGSVIDNELDLVDDDMYEIGTTTLIP